MSDTRALAILVFTAEGSLVRYNQEAFELTGYRSDQVDSLSNWLEDLLLGPGGRILAQKVLGPTRLLRPVRFSALFRTFAGEIRMGHFTLVSTEMSGEAKPQILISILEQSLEADTVSEKDGPSATDSMAAVLERLKVASDTLLRILEDSSQRIIALAKGLRLKDTRSIDRWDELFQESFSLESLGMQVAIIQAATATIQQAQPTHVSLMNPDSPLTGVPLGRPVVLNLGLSLDKLERFWILSTLDALQGNRTQCATQLGLALRTVRNKINGYRLDGHKIPAPLKPGGRRPVRNTTAVARTQPNLG